MPPPRDDATERAALALLIATLTSQVVAWRESSEEQAEALQALARATSAANPWVAVREAIGLARVALDRTPQWAFGGSLLVVSVAVAVAGAPAATPVIASVVHVVGALVPGAASVAP